MSVARCLAQLSRVSRTHYGSLWRRCHAESLGEICSGLRADSERSWGMKASSGLQILAASTPGPQTPQVGDRGEQSGQERISGGQKCSPHQRDLCGSQQVQGQDPSQLATAWVRVGQAEEESGVRLDPAPREEACGHHAGRTIHQEKEVCASLAAGWKIFPSPNGDSFVLSAWTPPPCLKGHPGLPGAPSRALCGVGRPPAGSWC